MTLTDIISLIKRNHQFILNVQVQIAESGKDYQASRLFLREYYQVLFDHFALQRTSFYQQLIFLSPDDKFKKEIIFLEENAKVVKVRLLSFSDRFSADWGVKKEPTFRVDFLSFARMMRERVEFENEILLALLDQISVCLSHSTYTLNLK
ncbi:MAG: hypothetical protein K8S27_15390 [Candidatus Omnitrophica bacterium]|nr:hypothetical protein [Candidatus Omnitrophota bacterium]